jgi:hypothetical protein
MPPRSQAAAGSNRGIVDFASFEALTRGAHQIAGLYFFQQLDCLVDLAHQVSYDFFRRPQLYLNLGQTVSARQARPVAQVLAELHARFGYNELFPGTLQRVEIYRPVFGGGAGGVGEEGDFPRLRDALLDAAAAFAERVFDSGVEMLRERVRTTHRPFAQYLQGLQGDSLQWDREQALATLTEDAAYGVLRAKGVTGVFGVERAPEAAWPYTEDANGDKVVESISHQLTWAGQPAEARISRERISNLQRAALRGAEALVVIIDFGAASGNDVLNDLITRCYTWRAALLSVLGQAGSPMPDHSTASSVSNPLAEWTITQQGPSLA